MSLDHDSRKNLFLFYKGTVKQAYAAISAYVVKGHTDQWLDLRNRNPDCIDNGKFKHSVISLPYEITDLARKTRSCEGEDTDRAFENRTEVFAACQKFTDMLRKFFL